MNYYLRIICIYFFFQICVFHINGQTFKASVIVGVNAGQIDGDFEVGYNKFGVNTGFGVGINLKENMYLGTEFLYSQRGSKNALFDKDVKAKGSIQIDYIALPIVFKYYDWFDEEQDFYRVWLEGGAVPGRLINAKIIGSEQPDLINSFRANDISWFLGTGYQINKHFYGNFRYTRAIIPIYSNINADINQVQKLLSYFLTLQFGYTF